MHGFNFGPGGPKLSSAEKISKDSEGSATQIKQYIQSETDFA